MNGGIVSSASEAAKALGMEAATYRAYEREPGQSKSITMGHQAAANFGRRFKVNWVWLLTGEETPFGRQESEAIQSIRENLDGKSEEEQQFAADLIKRLFQKDGTNG